jgi:hypothetical protein
VKRLPVAVAAAFVILFYTWTARGGAPLGVGVPQDGYYNLLADAFRHGQLHLRVTPRSELFELADPFDPTKNDRYRLHDASLFHGKYYLYFGAAPGVAMFLPWQLAGLDDLPESLAALVLASGAALFSVLLLRHLLLRHQPDAPIGLQAVAVLTLGFANMAPFILRGAIVYEVAIAAGAFFLMGSAWLLVTAADADPPRPGRLALGSLLLGLAVGSRANHVVLAPLLLLLAWPALRDRRRRVRVLVAAAVPVALVLLLIGAYNRARFGSAVDFGTRYCLVGHPPLPWYTPRVSLVPALYFDLLAPPAVQPEFPFLLPEARFPGALPEGFYAEPTTGLLIHSPFLLALLAAPWLLRRRDGDGGLRSRIVLLAAIGAGSMIFTALVVPWATMRYEVDYAGFLALAAILVLFQVDARLRGRPRLFFRTVVGLSFGWTVVTVAALSITGHDDTLRVRNPALFQSLVRHFEPLRTIAAPLGGRHVPPFFGRALAYDGPPSMRVNLRIAVPRRLAAEREPLLASGPVGGSDVLWLGSVSPGRWTLALTTAGGAAAVSPPFDLAPGGFHDVDVDLERAASQVMVRIDGVLRASLPGSLVPLRAATITLGRGPRGPGAEDLGHFSGTILSQGRLWAAPPGLEQRLRAHVEESEP